MKRLIEGIKKFELEQQAHYQKKIAPLIKGQKPQALFLTCADSRILPSAMTSGQPGDLFIIRNIGNMVPPCGPGGLSAGSVSVGAAIEYALFQLDVKDIIVCGHSECGAMQVIYQGMALDGMPNLESWLRLQRASIAEVEETVEIDESLSDLNQISQLNVLMQLSHLKTYPPIYRRINQGTLQLHAWWFDIKHAKFYEFDEQAKRYKPLIAAVKAVKQKSRSKKRTA